MRGCLQSQRSPNVEEFLMKFCLALRRSYAIAHRRRGTQQKIAKRPNSCHRSLCRYPLKPVKLLFFFLLSACSLCAKESSDYLKHKIPLENHRYRTFLRALQLMEERDLRTIVETGTARFGDRYFDSDGGSTIIFAEWAQDHRADLFTVDISMTNLAISQSAVERYVSGSRENIHYICSDSIAYLRKFNQTIDFLYLDSFDYELDNPSPSQLHHLQEIEAAYPFLSKHSIVMIDDCDLPGGGKGKLAIEFLLQRGWKILHEGYQVILVTD